MFCLGNSQSPEQLAERVANVGEHSNHVLFLVAAHWSVQQIVGKEHTPQGR